MEEPVIAAFDFDGTITYHDSLLPFFIYIFGIPKVILQFLKEFPSVLAFLLKKNSRDQFKEKILTRFFKGMSIEHLEKLAQAYAKDVLPKKVRPEALEKIKWHQKQNHILILISASLDIYLHPWANEFGFFHLLTSSLEITDEGIITGKLNGKNCRGKEKTRRLLELFNNSKPFILYAYGDSRGDKELLELADFSYYRRFQ